MLPDTFGTTQFLEGAPDWAADWTGQRIDSKNPYVAGDEYIDWLKARGREPQDKLIIASDALDVDEITRPARLFWWGTSVRVRLPQIFAALPTF